MCDPELAKAMHPLANYLATRNASDPIHREFIADLYDIVNEIRDTKISELEDMIIKVRQEGDFLRDREKRLMVLNLHGQIRRLQGE